ncbi:E-selectin-like [Lytechinus variegatus]|uniref:E-selectin-like n=1 Tax=Lytechinus variegatus TaxID=7654 RepID=UPI001BB0EB1E|nr:E-selectin-like [Lytechinus variegatus]
MAERMKYLEVVTCTVTLFGDKVSSSCTPATQVDYQEECTFSCPAGYELIGPSSVTCTSFGGFSDVFPECEVVTCTVNLFGDKVSSSCTPATQVDYQEECTFSCPAGYELIGPSSVTCTSFGGFSDVFPVCEVVTCTVTLFGDKVSSSCTPATQVDYQEECTFSCPAGYELIGPSSVTCTSFGGFSDVFPECEATCTVPDFEIEVTSSCTPGEEVSLNQECTFSCPPGYDLTGPSFVTCESSGQFSDQFPQCQTTCTVPDLGIQVTSSCIPGEEVSLNQGCTFSCLTGYELIGIPLLTCTSSRDFSDEVPQCQNINECDPYPCINGGTCIDGINSYTCDCTFGFTGMNCSTECTQNHSVCKRAEFDLEISGVENSTRTHAAIPIGSSAVQSLKDRVVNTLESLLEVIGVNGAVISANDDAIGLFTTARIRLNVTYDGDVTIQQLIPVLAAAIEGIGGFTVQSLGLLTNPCSLENPCADGFTCGRVDNTSAKVRCIQDMVTTDTPDTATVDSKREVLIISLPIIAILAILFFVVISFVGFAVRRKRQEMKLTKGDPSYGIPGYLKRGPTGGYERPRPQTNPRIMHEMNAKLEMGLDSGMNDGASPGFKDHYAVHDNGFSYGKRTGGYHGYLTNGPYHHGATNGSEQPKGYNGKLDTYF